LFRSISGFADRCETMRAWRRRRRRSAGECDVRVTACSDWHAILG